MAETIKNQSENPSEELSFEDSSLNKNLENREMAKENGYFVFEKSSDTIEKGKKPKNKIHFLGLK